MAEFKESAVCEKEIGREIVMDESKESAVCEKEIERAIAMDESKESAVCEKEIGAIAMDKFKESKELMHRDLPECQTLLVHRDPMPLRPWMCEDSLPCGSHGLMLLIEAANRIREQENNRYKFGPPRPLTPHVGSQPKDWMREDSLDWMREDSLDWMRKMRKDWLDWMRKDSLDWMREDSLDWMREDLLDLMEIREQETNRHKNIIMQKYFDRPRPLTPHVGSQPKEHLVDLKPVPEKKLQNSDVQKRQNRLLIPITDVLKNLIPFLSLEERRDANLLDLKTKNRKRNDERSSGTDSGDCRRKERKAGRKHGGLEVRLITKVREIGMMLTQWDGTRGVVLKGGAEWKDIVTVQKLQRGDSVQLLVFRRSATTVKRPGATTELCFVLRKNSCSRAGSTAAVEPAPEARQMINIQSEQLDLRLSLSLPAYLVPQNGANLASKNSIVGAVVKSKEEAFDENGINLELTLRQPGSEVMDLS